MLTIGIDIGLQGGVAVAAWGGGGVVLGGLVLHPMPVVAAQGGKKRVDDRALGDMLGELAIAGGVALVAYERVHAMPRQGSVSMFSFGRSLGVVEMALALLRLPNVAVEPARWKRDMQAPKDKAAVRLMAARLLPEWAAQWQRVRDDGIAEAALLAVWARRHGMGAMGSG
jgi:crossover junction endodeoxyribonuclease RuvC